MLRTCIATLTAIVLATGASAHGCNTSSDQETTARALFADLLFAGQNGLSHRHQGAAIESRVRKIGKRIFLEHLMVFPDGSRLKFTDYAFDGKVNKVDGGQVDDADHLSCEISQSARSRLNKQQRAP